MNSKRKNFIILNSIVIVCTILLVLFSNYMILANFMFSKDIFIVMNILLIIFGLTTYTYLSNALLEPLFKSEKNLQKTVKETLHELNIPASTIQINAQMLSKTVTEEKSIKRLNRIKQATQDLLQLYNQMEYDIKSQIDKVEYQEFCLKEVIQISVKKFQDIKNDIKINIEVDETIVTTDKNAFTKVIDNLISNAIKYNVSDGLINIKFIESNLSIYNTGKSIDTKNIFMIFDKYYQEDLSSNGFGLGLNIVKDFCDKNKIIIKIDSEDNGTTISLNLSSICQI